MYCTSEKTPDIKMDCQCIFCRFFKINKQRYENQGNFLGWSSPSFTRNREILFDEDLKNHLFFFCPCPSQRRWLSNLWKRQCSVSTFLFFLQGFRLCKVHKRCLFFFADHFWDIHAFIYSWQHPLHYPNYKIHVTISCFLLMFITYCFLDDPSNFDSEIFIWDAMFQLLPVYDMTRLENICHQAWFNWASSHKNKGVICPWYRHWSTISFKLELHPSFK